MTAMHSKLPWVQVPKLSVMEPDRIRAADGSTVYESTMDIGPMRRSEIVLGKNLSPADLALIVNRVNLFEQILDKVIALLDGPGVIERNRDSVEFLHARNEIMALTHYARRF